MRSILTTAFALGVGALAAAPQSANAAFFSTGNPDGLMAAATRPSSGGGTFEIETGDDFVLSPNNSRISTASFTGLLPSGASLGTIGNVRLEIYRVFPKDSQVPPSNNVPTRVNSPSDVAFAERDVATASLTFSAVLLNPTFAANNSVQPGGIHAKPNQTTLGNGPVTGEEVRFDLVLSTPIDLPADHYFFVPQVELSTGTFLWLSAPKPIVPPGTPFPAGSTDLQAWTRDEFLAPDWLRIGTDIVGGATPPTFNMAFSLDAVDLPEPSTLLVLGGGLALLAWRYGRRRTTG